MFLSGLELDSLLLNSYRKKIRPKLEAIGYGFLISVFLFQLESQLETDIEYRFSAFRKVKFNYCNIFYSYAGRNHQPGNSFTVNFYSYDYIPVITDPLHAVFPA